MESNQEKTRSRSGARALIESLERAGVEVAFGYPGGNVIDIFDCLGDAQFRFVLGRHEQGVVHMADGYARRTGKPGVCLVTSGPGATNAITGLATANVDGVPLVLVSGQVPLWQIGTDAFQEADMTGICRAATKHSFLVKSADEIPTTVAEAFYIATHGKPGAVVIDIPKNVQEELTEAQYPERISLRAYHPDRAAEPRDVTHLARLINAAQRPVIYAGGGVITANAAEDVASLAHKAQIPVATTLMGLGAFDEGDSLALGLAGMHGSVAANRAIDKADLVLALGVRFNDRVTGALARYARRAKIVHVDCDASSIDKNVPVTLGIVADVKNLLQVVNSRVRAAEHPAWLAEIATWKAEHPYRWKARQPGVIMPQAVVEAIDRVTESEAVIVTDVGQHQMWCAQHLCHKHPRHFITPGGMGTMGFGMPAAIGAAIACPDSTTIAVVGDGGFQMTVEELMVAVEERVPLTVVLMNNGGLGMVRQFQKLFYGGRRMATDFGGKKGHALPDFVALVRACGAFAFRVTQPNLVAPTIARAMRLRCPVVVEVMVDPEADVYPMVPAGGTIEDTLEEND